MVVCDTDFLIDVLHRRPGAIRALQELTAGNVPVWMAAPSLQELYYGAWNAARPEPELARITQLDQAVPSLPFSAAAARIAGKASATLTKAGKRPAVMDLQIAATALVHGEAVLTADASFPALDGLSIQRYSR